MIGSYTDKWGFHFKTTKREIVRLGSTESDKAVKINIPSNMSKDSEKEDSAPKTDMKILCLNLDVFSRPTQFLLCCLGVFFFYLIYGYFQELIFRLEGFKPYGWYLTLMQFLFYTLFGLAELSVKEDHSRKIPLKMYWILAFLTVATMGLSNSSLGYLNYPTQVIFKCCKLIPVLIGGVIIQGKVYKAIDCTACFAMSIGLIFFTLADSTVSPNFSLYGVTLISLALCADAVIGNVQEKTMKQYGASNSEMVLYSYGIGFFYILLGEIVSGDLKPAFNFCLEYPLQTYGYGFIFSLTGYLGVSIVLNLVKSFGALVAVTVTTCRKALTIILSFIFFAKPFTGQYIWSGLIVVLGIYLNIYSKNKTQWDAKFKGLYQRIFQSKKPVEIADFGNIV